MRVKSPPASTGDNNSGVNKAIGIEAADRDAHEILKEIGIPDGPDGIQTVPKSAATEEDLEALARITQDILEAMAQKPAHGGHYKELEDLLKVGRGYVQRWASIILKR